MIKNSIFKDINVHLNRPLFNIYESHIEIYNSIFENCFTDYGHLIYLKTIDHNRYKENDYMIIKDSTFNNISSLINGYNNHLKVFNCNFNNIKNRASSPVILDTHYSSVYITNSNFHDIISLGSGLFNENSDYIITDTIFTNITTNSKSMISTTYKNLYLENCSFLNILCNGDNEDSSLIDFISSDYGNILELTNIVIKDSKSNGDFILIKGSKSISKIFKSKIDNIFSYGSFIKDLSLSSELHLNDTLISNYKNINKSICGIISYYNNINITINNSIFTNNTVRNNGGLLCISSIENMNIDITSSIFENNQAINGGAIYLNKDSNNNNNKNNIKLNNNVEIDRSISVHDTTFINNKAKYFGGVVYLDCDNINLSNFKNVSFIGNNAYAGGLLYINNNNNNNNTLFDPSSDKTLKLLNNTSESHGDHFATGPYRTNLINNESYEINVKSGEIISLDFVLVDKFNHVVKDISKYYSNIILDINNNINNVKISGNVGYFTAGLCKFNAFKVYTQNVTNNIYFNLTLESDDRNIFFNNGNLKMNIMECDDEQIKIRTKDNYFYCEKPICNGECANVDINDNNSTFVCVKGDIENVNSVKYNSCQCVLGYTGDKCQYMDYVLINYQLNRGLSFSLAFIVVFIIIFITVNKEEKIIKDTGFLKCELTLLGILLYFISQIFDTFSNYSNCALNFLLKHSGILLIYVMFFTYIYTGYELGMDYKELERLNLNIFKSETNICNNEEIRVQTKNKRQTIRESILFNIEKELNNFGTNHDNDNKKKKSTSKVSVDKKSDMEILSNLNKNVFEVHNICMEVTIMYFITCIIILFSVIICKYKDIKYYQELDGKWRYQCSLTNMENIMNLFEFIIIIYLIVLFIRVLHYTYVFKVLRYIGYSSIIWITMGPLPNLISYLSLYDDNYSYNLFNTLINSLCYSFILILFVWDKIYFISQKEGNNVDKYFYSLKCEECLIHKSYLCGCNKSNSEYDVIEKYINFYKYCSQIIVYSSGKLMYIRMESKNQLKFTI
ncbi:hypothetical protein BCR32DRAFT_250582 [Anaeromyces robustus]|uniref:EGF-like domain-containing protein n=1 Tax=Anaeromyces robustus TaxID=1754192 RepID=A0A1Y1VWW7_9FUNG|nr:hypothetical protein BCR32DRAFT_250582 [Anaeromyces robustus]|eukprot:ORX65789.1 hypothetical protein BCR32DRAFT_250582 [Anaeromyces robustus]